MNFDMPPSVKLTFDFENCCGRVRKNASVLSGAFWRRSAWYVTDCTENKTDYHLIIARQIILGTQWYINRLSIL